jgi:hypothetical protein
MELTIQKKMAENIARELDAWTVETVIRLQLGLWKMGRWSKDKQTNGNQEHISKWSKENH